MVRRIGLYLTLILSFCYIIISFLSLLDDRHSFLLKILNFPRLQFLLLGIILIAGIWLFRPGTKRRRYTLLLSFAMISALTIHLLVIKNYTFLVETSVQSFEEGDQSKASFKLMLANVEMTNREYRTFILLVREVNPDLLLVMETDEAWLQSIQPVTKGYQYKKEVPLNNTYGMALYSKMPLEKLDVKYLSNKDVPSIHATVVLPGNHRIQFIGVHPVPPVPVQYPNSFGNTDNELQKIGNIVSKERLPTVVAGDFNDVAWSDLSTLFAASGELQDVRTGRGLFNTYDANSVFMRWPLDHVYVSKGFSVQQIERSKSFGSDHYALIATLHLM